MPFSEAESAAMANALRLAARGRNGASPNPMVGCIIMKDEQVVGSGWHNNAGGDHAEVHALREAGSRAGGSTVFVTLEPCAHFGKTPPCADALIAAGVHRVVVATEDPFDEVAGRGLQKLRDAGVVVDVGLQADAAAQLNRGFFSRVMRQRPFVRLKLACSLDGAVAMSSGESQWITGPDARRDVQRLRRDSDAIMTGIGTVLADDPSLTVRGGSIAEHRQPLRVVLDSRCRMSAQARMLSLPGSTLIMGCSPNGPDKTLEDVEYVQYPGDAGRVSLADALQELAIRGINNLLVEAGPTLAGELLGQQRVDELVIYQSPHIMGSQTRAMALTPSWTALSDRLELSYVDVRHIGRDIRITAQPRRQS